MIDENGIERQSCLTHIPDDVEYTSEDGIFMKGMIMEKAGTIVAQHSHEYGHTTAVVSGSVRVWKDEEFLGDFEAPAFIFIEAKKFHKILSLKDNTVAYCIHNISATNGSVIIHQEARVA